MSVSTVSPHPSIGQSALAIGGTSALAGGLLATTISESTGAVRFNPKLGAVALAGTLAGGIAYDVVRRKTDNNGLAVAAGLGVGAGAWAGARALLPHSTASVVASALLGVIMVGGVIGAESFSKK